jgi:lipopolysaccharide transport system ATP-binding protein
VTGGDLAIRLTGVGKRFTRYEDTPALTSSLRNVVRRTRRSSLWAVRDLDLDVGHGESVGLIGRNGSGKSTLLQMLCGVTAPSEGEVRVRGRIAPLIAVGVGFHPELTGRENVLVNGSILGMSRAEVDRKMDAIIAFSGIEAFLDTPIKFYSSGMNVRLGFSVAVHAEPEVLLVDEVLAVGDLSFQVRSFQRMQGLQRDGTTIVVVSHDLHAVQRLCPRTLVVDGGRRVFDGPTTEAVSTYHDVLAQGGGAPDGYVHERGSVTVEDVHILDGGGRRTAHLVAGDRMRVRLRVRCAREVDAPFAVVQVRTQDGTVVYSDSNVLQPYPCLRPGEVGDWEVELTSRLPSGSYVLTVSVARAAGGAGLSVEELLDDLAVLASPPPVLFYVAGRPMVHGTADLEGRFRLADGA